MKRCTSAILACLMLAAAPAFAYAQAEFPGPMQDMTFSAALGFDYFTRSLEWDDATDSGLKSYILSFRPQMTFLDRFTLGGIIGYAASDFDLMTYRNLPISLELDAQRIAGLLVGGELDILLTGTDQFEINAVGDFVSYSGQDKSWEIPGLSVEGTASGKPSWSRLRAGLRVTYTVYAAIQPYLFAGYERLAGKFELEESILDLSGTETKEFTSQGLHSAAGLIYALAANIDLRGEANLFVRSGTIDFGAFFGFRYSF